MEFTALLAPMNQVDQQIDDLRHLDPAAGSGLPAHVTLLYPFGPVDQIDTEVVSRWSSGTSDGLAMTSYGSPQRIRVLLSP